MLMTPTAATPKTESWAGDLADAALPVVLRHKVRGSSVDVEMAIGRAVERALRGVRSAEPEDVAAVVADGVYQAALRRGLSGNFLDLRLDLWHALQQAIA